MTSLWRNREFTLLWTSQSLSDLGNTIASLAVPLLVLVLTGSPVQAGIVGTVVHFVDLACQLPSGVLADRLDRRRTMLACDAVRLIVWVALGVAVATGRASLGVIIAVAVIDAMGSTLFQTAEHASLRSIVPAAQLPTAVARNEARSYGTSLAGPPLGGLLFGLGHALPFAGNALSYLLSLVGVALIRKPLQAAREEEPTSHGAAMAEGVRFVFGHAFLRTVLLIAAPLNFAMTGFLFSIVVILQRHGTSPGVIGLAETIVGAGGLLGAFAAPALQSRISLALLVRAFCWAGAALLVVSSLLTASVLVAVPIGVLVFLAPSCNAALFGYQAAITPDRLQGRVVSVVMLVATSAAALAPLLSGLVIDAWGGPATILVFAAAIGGSAIAATLSRAIGSMRPLETV
jgi:MFS family permease